MNSRNITSTKDKPAGADAVLPSSSSRASTATTMSGRKRFGTMWVDAVTLVVVFVVFIVPFVFILLTAAKTSQEAALFEFSWPTQFQLLDNLRDVLAYEDGRMFLALFNSTLLTVGSVTIIVLIAALTAYVMQRRSGRV